METDLLEFLAAAESLKQSHPEVLIPVGWVALLFAWAAFQLVRPVKFGKIAEMMATTIADPNAKWKWTDATKKAIGCALSNGENLVISPKKRDFQIGRETVTSLMGRRERKALCRRAKTVVKRLKAADHAALKRTAEQKMAQVVNRLSPLVGDLHRKVDTDYLVEYKKADGAKQIAPPKTWTVNVSTDGPVLQREAQAAPVKDQAAPVKDQAAPPISGCVVARPEFSPIASDLIRHLMITKNWRAGMSKGKPTGNSIVIDLPGRKYVINFKTRQFEMNGNVLSLVESEKDSLMPHVKVVAYSLGLTV